MKAPSAWIRRRRGSASAIEPEVVHDRLDSRPRHSRLSGRRGRGAEEELHARRSLENALAPLEEVPDDPLMASRHALYDHDGAGRFSKVRARDRHERASPRLRR